MEDFKGKMDILLKAVNDTFEFDLVIEDGEVLEVKIKSLKDNGAKFYEELVEVLDGVIGVAMPDHELVYNEKSGFSLVKK